jgi:hypothetical protein
MDVYYLGLDGVLFNKGDTGKDIPDVDYVTHADYMALQQQWDAGSAEYEALAAELKALENECVELRMYRRAMARDIDEGQQTYAHGRSAMSEKMVDEAICKHCGGESEWFTTIRNNSQVVDGRLKTSDVECIFVRGCSECSETLEVRRADDVVAIINAALAHPHPTDQCAQARNMVEQAGEVVDSGGCSEWHIRMAQMERDMDVTPSAGPFTFATLANPTVKAGEAVAVARVVSGYEVSERGIESRVAWLYNPMPEGAELYELSAAPESRPTVPDALPDDIVIFGDDDDDGYRMGWNACRHAMLSAAPEPGGG